MRVDELLEHLAGTLDDGRLSRGERRALQAALRDEPLSEAERNRLQAGLFDLAAQAMHDPRDRQPMRWIEACLGALRGVAQPEREQVASRAWFGPEDPLAKLLASQLEAARERIDAAVYTITDDTIAEALRRAHERGVRVRILSDDEKTGDPGSDIWRLQRAGLAVRTDQSPTLMHHKFAVIDEHTLLNGSYNWTRSGASENQENFLVTGDPALVHAYSQAFERLWRAFDPDRS
jgi:cardiolipin hydrolase